MAYEADFRGSAVNPPFGSADDSDAISSGLGEDAMGRPLDRISDAAASAAHSVADAFGSGVRYLRERDLRDMLEDVVEVVKDHPEPSLIAAVALGFLVGRTLSRG